MSSDSFYKELSYSNDLDYLNNNITNNELDLIDINKIILNSPKNKEKLYLIHNVLAEIALEKDSMDDYWFNRW